MRTLIALCLLSLTTLWIAAPGSASAADPKLAHNVYFSLKDNSDAAKDKVVASCKKYLSGHPDTVFFAVGVLAKDMKRPVNDQDFDVSIHVVFTNKAAHDKYNTSERHLKFIDENKAAFKKVSSVRLVLGTVSDMERQDDKGTRFRRLRHPVRCPFRAESLRGSFPRPWFRPDCLVANEATGIHMAAVPHGPLRGLLAHHRGWPCIRLPVPRARFLSGADQLPDAGRT